MGIEIAYEEEANITLTGTEKTADLLNEVMKIFMRKFISTR